jgi:hypothetical protein
MALPKISTPIFSVTLPVSKLEINFRPFLVKEEKVLLIGKESGPKQQMMAIRQLLESVVVQPEDFSPDNLSMIDIEWLFLQLRSKSVQNITSLRYRDKEDDEIYKFDVDLDDIQPVFNEAHQYVIFFEDQGIGVKLKDPTFGVIRKLELNEDSDSDSAFAMIASCIEQVYDADQVYDDFTLEEAVEFLRQMDMNMFAKVQEFYETLPKLSYTLDYVNKNGTARKIVLEGLNDFF